MKIKEIRQNTKKCYYPVKFRWKIIQQIEIGILEEQQACEKYGIASILIRKWRKQYFQRHLKPHLNPRSMKPKQSQAEKIKALEKQLKQTQKALEDEKRKSRAYEIMIDIAEKELNVPVRKKHGPGASGPNSRTSNQGISFGRRRKRL